MNKPNNPPAPNSEAVPATDNFQTLLDAGAASAGLRSIPTGLGVPVITIPSGYDFHVVDVKEVERWNGKPNRKTGRFSFSDLESFIRYYSEHKTEDSRIFAAVSDTGANFIGVLNFHGAEPSFNDHHAHMELIPTTEWKIWMATAHTKMPQMEFARFLEDNSEMFTQPQGLDLLDLVTELEGKSHVDITQAVKLQTGAIKLNYSEVVELKGGSGNQSGEMIVPKELTVNIAPFEGTARREMKARLRFRIENKRILFSYDPIHSHWHVRALIEEVLNTIYSQTGTEPFKTHVNSGLNIGGMDY